MQNGRNSDIEQNDKKKKVRPLKLVNRETSVNVDPTKGPEPETKKYGGSHVARKNYVYGIDSDSMKKGSHMGKYEAKPIDWEKYSEAETVKESEYEITEIEENSENRPVSGNLVLKKRVFAESDTRKKRKDGEKKNMSKEKNKKVKKKGNVDLLISLLSVLMSLVMICLLVIYMPIFRDSVTQKRVSAMYLFKNWQPLVSVEGKIDKTKADIQIDEEKVDEDFSDGLDLPQLVEGQFSVLLLGFDEDVFNTDVIWVCQFDIGHGKLNILQVPRDCCLPDYTTSATGKINSVYTMGNPYVNPPVQRVVNAIQENFGIPIDAYITTVCYDIVDMVDLIGGIPIHIDNEIVYEADKIIPAGDIVLSGAQAEWFIRFRREWLEGDIGRMQNQRRFMAAAMNKLISIVNDEGKLKLYSYMKEIYNNEYIYTDMTLENISMLADFASTLSMDDVQVNMVPGEGAKYYAPDGKEYDVYSVHKFETIDMLNAYFRPYQKIMTASMTSIVELVKNHTYNVYDDTGTTLEEIEDSTEPKRDPAKAVR